MNIDIRNHIKNNFKGSSTEEIEESIVESIKSKEEVVLPGLGVLFETVWNNSPTELKNSILNILKNNL